MECLKCHTRWISSDEFAPCPNCNHSSPVAHIADLERQLAEAKETRATEVNSWLSIEAGQMILCGEDPLKRVKELEARAIAAEQERDELRRQVEGLRGAANSLNESMLRGACHECPCVAPALEQFRKALSALPTAEPAKEDGDA